MSKPARLDHLGCGAQLLEAWGNAPEERTPWAIEQAVKEAPSNFPMCVAIGDEVPKRKRMLESLLA